VSSGADKQSQVHDELLMVELRDAFLTVERTLIERGQLNTVRQTRLTFQQAMFSEFLDAVEGIAGRQVCSYVSESITSPEVTLEIFYLEPTADVPRRLQQEAARGRRRPRASGRRDRGQGSVTPVSAARRIIVA
jgi:uncharacterized protein YbcI